MVRNTLTTGVELDEFQSSGNRLGRAAVRLAFVSSRNLANGRNREHQEERERSTNHGREISPARAGVKAHAAF